MRKILLSLSVSFLFAAAALAAGAPAAGETVTGGAKVDRDRTTVGDPVNYTVTIVSPLDYRLVLPEKQAEIGPWEVKDFRVYQEKKDKLYNYLNYTLAAFTTGQVTIPAMTFELVDVKGSTVTATTGSAAITVESVMGLVKGPAGLRDIKPPLSLNIPAGVYLFWLIVLAAAGFGAWYWYGQYRKRLPALPAGPVEPPVPPMQAAITALETLKKSGLAEEGKMKEFYIALSDIIRTYLGAVYSVDTLDKTTGEIYRELRAEVADKKALVFIKEFFEDCDLVKFAKYRPEPKTAWADFERAERIVKT